MKEVELSDIYQMLKESVWFSSHTNNDLRPKYICSSRNEQTFLSDVSNEQLGYTILCKNKLTIFQGHKKATGYNPSFCMAYPGVFFVFEQSMTPFLIIYSITNLKALANISQCTCSGLWYYQNRYFESALPYKTVSELYVDAENILLNLFKYFDRCCIASTTLDSKKNYTTGIIWHICSQWIIHLTTWSTKESQGFFQN